MGVENVFDDAVKSCQKSRALIMTSLACRGLEAEVYSKW